MKPPRLTCGVVIYSKRETVVKTCGHPTTHQLVFGGDHLFAVCNRHNARLQRAIPTLANP